jgi:predicted N-formylglutamate amidohydrolase
MARRRSISLVLSCEHGGHRVPSAYRELFAGADAILRSHRGWDRGALVMARALARKFDTRLFESTVTRLLVDLNRTETNRGVFSVFARDLSRGDRDTLLEAHHRPYRLAVRQEIAARIASKQPVVHVSVHSFTPELDGRLRTTDIGLLYDPCRAPERARAATWARALKSSLPELTIHRNAPYRGTSDGLTRWLRTQFCARDYVGLELELNQRWVVDPRWPTLRRTIVHSVAALLDLEP